MSILILGDPHLGASQSLGKTGIGASLNSRIVDQINLLDWTLDQAIDENVSDIIITGDVFEDPKPAPYLISLFISWVKKCQSNNIKVHIIIGNHDILRSGNFYTSPLDIISEAEIDNVHVYKNIDTLFINNSAFTLIPFRDRKSFNCQNNSDAIVLLKDIINYELSSIPLTYKKIVVGHLCLDGSIPIGDEIDDMANELICPLDMFTGYDYVWMGHVHKPQVMCDKPHISHIGSMDISNYGETEQEKNIIIYNDGNFLTKKIPTRNLKKITIVIPKDTENTTAYVIDKLSEIKNFNKSIIKLEVSLSSTDLLSVDKKIIEKCLYDKGVFNISNFSENKKINFIKKEGQNISKAMTEMSAIKLYSDTFIEEKNRKIFIELASDVYSEFKNEVKD
jgi:exonuclease SbcD